VDAPPQTGDNGKDTQPVTLTHVPHGGRIVYTSLGVPEDFKNEDFRRLLINALLWAANREPQRMRK
jgi:type 1 glutamine amidotransferase